MIKTLQSEWFNWYKKKLHEDFDFDVTKVENYQPDLSPLVYCCMQHKKITSTPRQVILSREFEQSEWENNPSWISLSSKIEKGLDVNGYLSKKVNDWQTVDYLLYVYNISHIHLKKSSNGGIGDELVFGIFLKDTFYVICIGNHHDIYNVEALVSVANSNWPNDGLFHFVTSQDAISKTSNVIDLKRVANDPNLQYNLISPLTSINHQNTAITDFKVNNIQYKKLPIKAVIAYMNEIKFLENLYDNLYREYQAKKMSLSIDEKKGEYLIDIHLKRSIRKKRRIPRRFITCSMYMQHN